MLTLYLMKGSLYILENVRFMVGIFLQAHVLNMNSNLLNVLIITNLLEIMTRNMRSPTRNVHLK